MKTNIKKIIIIFLVAFLGAGLGTYGSLTVYNLMNPNEETKSDVLIQQVTYPTVEKTNYSTAIEKAYDSVVEITTVVKTTSGFFYSSSTSSVKGSGVIISSDGYIVTNEHVIDGQISINVKLANSEEFTAELIGYDTKTDLAVIKINCEYELPFATFADSDSLTLGSEVIAIGNSLGEGTVCSNGIVSAISKEVTINNYSMQLIQTNAAVNEGNSGGGLFDINGNLVGIVNAKHTETSTSTSVEGMGYAIPSNSVIKISKSLIDYGYVKRASLGIAVNTPNSYYSFWYSTQQTHEGVLITKVIENGSADKAGIQVGDYITKIDNETVDSFTTLSKLMDKYEIGDVVVLEIYRDGKTLNFNVTLQDTETN